MTGGIVLFDLDGTALTFEGPSPGPGRTALDRTMRDLHGIERATEGIRVAGGTDRAIARTMLRKAGVIADDEAVARVLAGYEARLQVVLETRRYRPLGDVASVVRELEARGVVVGIATGNTRVGAALKLASAGLDAVFDTARGGYGCEAELRADIVRMAIARCSSAASPPIVVVGDTEHDVSAGRAAGAGVVGVAMSAAARAELEAAGADAVVDECDDALLEAVLATLGPRRSVARG
jgi:phosphoglycolate phosphatase-like HAD superfamily hydrolase